MDGRFKCMGAMDDVAPCAHRSRIGIDDWFEFALFVPRCEFRRVVREGLPAIAAGLAFAVAMAFFGAAG